MKSINQFPIYELGRAMQHYKDVAEQTDPTPFVQSIAVLDARMHLSRLIDEGEFDIGFCRASAEELQNELNSLVVNELQDDEGRLRLPEKPLSSWQLQTLIKSIETFEHQLSAELKKVSTYLVPERGIFNTERLVDDADKHIHESVRSAVPEFSLDEIKRAGRCLAFGLYSASGFHSGRAVETMTKVYYEKFLGTPKNKKMTLGLMVSNLNDMHEAKNKKDPLPKENTLRYLKDFVDLDRNPLMHRMVNLSEIDAMALFNGASAAIVEMAKEIVPNYREMLVASILVSKSNS